MRLLPFALVVGIVFLFGLHNLTSVYQDIGRHLTLGRIIWETKQVPDTNLFSYTNPGFPFQNHHWFAEVLLYGGERLIGLGGLIVVKALLIASAFGLALAAAWRPHLALPGMTVGMAAAAVLIERTDLRPEVLSFVFLGWFLFVLYRQPTSSPATSYKLLWTLPFVQLLWVNSHIYFFMGPFLWLAFLVGEGAKRDWRSEIRDWRKVGAKGAFKALLSDLYFQISVAIVVATLANPHGISGVLYPLQVFENYGYSVVENKSLFFLASFGYPPFTSYALYGSIVLAGASFVLNGRTVRRNIFGLVVCAGTAVMALVMIRNFPLFALCMVPAVLKNLDEVYPLRNRVPRGALGWGMAVLALVGASIVTSQFYDQAGLGRRFGLSVPAGPEESVRFFREARIHGPIFNNFDIGSFLIWKLPEEPVFIDGRPEAYPADFIQNVYIPMQEDAAVWERESVRYGINAIFWNEQDITPWSRTFVARILNDPRWVPVYRGQGVLILVRNAPANADIVRRYRLRE